LIYCCPRLSSSHIDCSYLCVIMQHATTAAIAVAPQKGLPVCLHHVTSGNASGTVRIVTVTDNAAGRLH
jgi:hypothetical protein